jgi:phage baseplate assembly protein gpV
MPRIRKALIAGAVAGLALAGGLAGPAAAVPGQNPNDPAYYGPDCTKVEYVDGTTTYTVAAGTVAYIKAGTQITRVVGPATITLDKDISFVITCPYSVYPPYPVS